MSNQDLNVALRLSADSSRLVSGLAKGERGLHKFGSAAKREMQALGNFAGSVEGKLAQLGLGVSAVAAGMQSAQLDKDLKQLQLTAGATADEADRLRKALLGAQTATGQGTDELLSGVDALVAGGLSLGEATATVAPMAETLAVATTNADALAKAMGVAGKMFNIDLSQTTEARLLLDKMVVAGRAGNAELENLPDVFARVGPAAKSANLNLDETLALVETLSLYEPNAERLATQVDSTLRIFNNASYMKDAAKAANVKFFDAEGNRRNALEITSDIKRVYDTLDSDKQRAGFINKAFGKADQDSRKGMQNLLDNKALSSLDGILSDVSGAGGTISRDVADAIGNAVDQTGRLKGALREAADGFAQPINDALSGAIKWGLDSKQNGGLGLSGTDILAGGALGAAGIFGAARYGGKAIKGLAGKFGSVGVGVATGKALESAAGVQPVFVVNMGDGMGGTLGAADGLASKAGDLLSPKTFSKLKTTLALLGGSPLAALPSFGAGAMALSAGAVAGAGAAGYGAGTLVSDYLLTDQGFLGSDWGASIGDSIGAAVAHVLSPFSEDARAAIAANEAAETMTGQESTIGKQLSNAQTATGPLGSGAVIPGNALAAASHSLSEQLMVAVRGVKPEPAEVTGLLRVKIDSDRPARVTQLQTTGGIDMSADTGVTGAGR